MNATEFWKLSGGTINRNQDPKNVNDFNNIDYYIYIEDMSIRSTHLDYWI